ncbi:hypothetical protein GCM10009533_64560 [Saccharopolyspora spinosporotrichia]|uniref:Uncharacterized protein n=1 Tax=Saccharopolyspora erythraea TaxID=1836 RepID=A0ABP3P149_SACER
MSAPRITGNSSVSSTPAALCDRVLLECWAPVADKNDWTLDKVASDPKKTSGNRTAAMHCRFPGPAGAPGKPKQPSRADGSLPAC